MATFHLTHPRLDGPAERTVIEPWLTQLSHVTVNAYAEPAAAVLAMVEPLPAPQPTAQSAPQPATGRRLVLAEAA
ncbi:hypothetical protein [Spirillospora sp. NPDC029432]|uniref:hypothetical protein n=1 Tax=Spirillospora sp. NPDC029432 TaxID=3154599 RepID=UPI003452C40A